MISDKEKSIAVESTKNGFFISDNEVGVLTNSPDFESQKIFLSNYMLLSPNPPENRFSEKLNFSPVSRGTGAIGLPGDLSSISRFVRGAFTRLNSVSPNDEQSSVSQVFHILGSVFQVRGTNNIDWKIPEFTRYSACINMDNGIYYYKTYENPGLCAVNLYEQELSGERIYTFPLITNWNVNYQR